ncbi:MAG TPA: cytochrome c oxidase subunit 3 [Phycisphaerae bacterium]|nr:cytochrome c oxidase subunit 3 [Phycisphaerae bacterium]
MTSEFESNPPSDPVSRSLGKSRPLHVAGAGTLGVALLVVSLSILFISTLIGYIVIRAGFHAPVSVKLPAGLWLSTGLLLISSVTIHLAIQSIRADRQKGLCNFLLLTFLLGIGFLVVQSLNWISLYQDLRHAEQAVQQSVVPVLNSNGGVSAPDEPLVERDTLLKVFYVFTFLHAVHVVGGLIPLLVVVVKAFLGVYSRNYYPGVRYSVIYWHFLDAAWIAILIVLLTTF